MYPRASILKKLLQIFARAASVFVLMLLCLLAALRIEHGTATTLPRPTGAFAVGRIRCDWVDAQATDPMASVPGRKRELLAWIWYPAADSKTPRKTADYLPPNWRNAVSQHMGMVLGGFLTRDLSRVRTNSIADAALSSKEHSYPVILLRAGLAALTLNYSNLAEDLASHGYVVVGFDAPYRTFVVVLSDGTVVRRSPQNNADLLDGVQQERLALKLVQAWTADMKWAVDKLEGLNAADPAGRFTGRLDLQRLGAIGHSLGGATALEFCRVDSRCKAGIDMDGAPLGPVVAEGVTQPFLFLLSDHGNEPQSETRPVYANIRAIYNRLPPDRRYEIVIRGANHFAFSDDGALLKSHIVLKVLRILHVLGMDGPRQLAISNACVHAFFDACLRRTVGPPPRMPFADYPEIQILD